MTTKTEFHKWIKRAFDNVATQDMTLLSMAFKAGHESRDAEIADLQILAANVKTVIAMLANDQLPEKEESDGTLSGDLFLAIHANYRGEWAKATLSSLRSRYPLPAGRAESQDGDPRPAPVPEVRSFVSSDADRGWAERGPGRVCPATDGPDALAYGAQAPTIGVDFGAGGDRTIWSRIDPATGRVISTAEVPDVKIEPILDAMRAKAIINKVVREDAERLAAQLNAKAGGYRVETYGGQRPPDGGDNPSPRLADRVRALEILHGL